MHIIIYTQIDFRINTGFEAIFCLFEYILYDFKVTKIKLMIDGKITQAGMLLLGNSDFDYMFQTAPSIMWRLYGADGMDKDYAIFKVPFINVVDKVFAKVRNLTYRYMPNQLTLFPMETEQYNSWLIRELLKLRIRIIS